MSFKEDIETFKQEICTHCRNNNCERGIVAVRYKNELQMKCCEFIRKDKRNEEVETKEVMKYLKSKWEKKQKRYCVIKNITLT